MRDGWTTGSTATAAALAALHFFRCGYVPEFVTVPLPPGVPGSCLTIPVVAAGELPGGVCWGMARKYAGDDPDVTDGMIIRAEIFPCPGLKITIEGGEGIGRVTLPGLDMPPGMAAINPAPRAQITAALREAAPGLGFKVVISAPDGERRARGTMNGRLGIVGGISILGTQGVVRPFSHAAWRAALEQFVAVNRAAREVHVALATGRRSQSMLERKYPWLSARAFMVAGDFVADALAMVGEFAVISWGCFFGKLLKLAQGCANTHAHVSDLDLTFLADVARMPQLAQMTTAQEALELLLAQKPGAIREVVAIARDQAIAFAGKDVTVHLFHTDGRELASL